MTYRRFPTHWITTFLCVAMAAAALAQRESREDAAFAQNVREAISETLDGIADPMDFPGASAKLRATFDQVIAYAPLTVNGPFRDAALAVRLVDHLQHQAAENRVETLRFLRASPGLASSLAFLVEPEDDRARLLFVLSGLMMDRREQLAEFAPLTAAICVVHDTPTPHPRHGGVGVEPALLFDHFAKNVKAMEFDPRTIAPELAVFIVDVPVSMEEMQWALEKYKGDRMIGRHYHSVPYDIDHFRLGRPKKIMPHPYVLPNLLVYGGVCVDQAFFAEHIAKAVGIPAVTVTGRAGGVGHAWVGYLVKSRRSAEWNFKEGCYDDYEDARGNVRHPQTGRVLSDGEIALLADFATRSREQQELAIALTDAVHRLTDVARDGRPWQPRAPAELTAVPARGADVQSRITLLEAAVNASPANLGAWRTAVALAETGDFDAQAKMRWAQALQRVSGKDHPDFAFAMLVPMIRSEADVSEQDRLWNWAFGTFRGRPDLAGAIRLEQGAMWERAGKPAEAWSKYQEVITRFINDTPVVRDALVASERLLREQGKMNDIVPLYANAFKRVRPAGRVAPQFRAGTNWHSIGTEYMRVLNEFGRAREAEAVNAQLNASEAR